MGLCGYLFRRRRQFNMLIGCGFLLDVGWVYVGIYFVVVVNLGCYWDLGFCGMWDGSLWVFISSSSSIWAVIGTWVFVGCGMGLCGYLFRRRRQYGLLLGRGFLWD